MFFDKSTPHGICVAPRDLWETPSIPHGHSPFRIRRKHGFLRSPLSFLSHRSCRFPADADSHRLRKICVYLPHQRCDLRFDQSSRMASVLLCGICGSSQSSRMAILHSTFEGPIPHYKTTRLFAEAYTPNLRKSPLFRFPQSLSCFLLQDNQRHFLLPHDIAPRLQSLSNLRHKT